jgi:UDP-N-acetylmuramate dehydrogenase
MRIEENVPLSSLTTFRTGGPARFLLTVESKEEVSQAVAFAKEKKLPIIPIGSGSNMLAPDEGMNAVFIKYLPDDISSRTENGRVIVSVGAGRVWDSLVGYAAENEWWGIENLSAIPGTTGAAVVQNIGAYGASLADTVLEVNAYDSKEEVEKKIPVDACAFGYRTSVFKHDADRYVITNVTFSFSLAPVPNIQYRDLKNHFEKTNEALNLKNIRNAVTRIRAEKFPPLSEFGTAGSFFLNPIIAENAVALVKKTYPDMPLFELPEGGVKIPLAWIFDHVMHLKGRRVGGAFVWDKQPLVLATEPRASANDVHTLAKEIVQDFILKTDIHITPEVRILGEKKNIFS